MSICSSSTETDAFRAVMPTLIDITTHNNK